MHPDIQHKIDELTDLIRAKSPKNAVGFTLEINYYECKASFDYRDADGLAKAGISMKNLAGIWVK